MKKIMMGMLTLSLAACQGENIEGLDHLDNVEASKALADTQWVLKYSQSDIGLKEPLTGLFTVTFDSDSNIEVSHECGSSQTTYSIDVNEDGTGGTAMSISSDNFMSEFPCDTSELMNYQRQLLNVTSFELTNDTLVLKEGDRDSLLLARRFTMCDSPAPLSGTASNDFFAPTTVWLTLANDAPADATAQFDAQYPDFMLLPSDQCDTRILASMNRNTLDKLRCDEAITDIAYNN